MFSGTVSPKNCKQPFLIIFIRFLCSLNSSYSSLFLSLYLPFFTLFTELSTCPGATSYKNVKLTRKKWEIDEVTRFLEGNFAYLTWERKSIIVTTDACIPLQVSFTFWFVSCLRRWSKIVGITRHRMHHRHHHHQWHISTWPTSLSATIVTRHRFPQATTQDV